jgi:hypothetical protein
MDSGQQAAADSHYFERLLPGLLPIIRARSGKIPQYDGLISLLGFTPETTVLAYRLIQPKTMVILHTKETVRLLDVVRDRTRIPLQELFHESFLHDDEHVDDILIALRNALLRFPPSSKIAIEITGGKKTMGVQIASAAASLGDDFKTDIDIIYIDYDDYMPRYRKPRPETNRLLVFPKIGNKFRSLVSVEAKGSSRQIFVDPVFNGRGFPIQENMVFVLMPFTERWSDRIWTRIKQICDGAGLYARRADDLFGDNLMEDIWGGFVSVASL